MNADLQRAKVYLDAQELSPERYAFFSESSQRWFVTHNTATLESFGRALDACLPAPFFSGAWHRMLHACIEMEDGWSPACGLTPALLGDDTLSDGMAKDLARDAKSFVSKLLCEPVNANDNEMLSAIDEALASLTRAGGIIVARLEAKAAQPLPFASAAA